MFDHYADLEYVLARVQLLLFMLGMGARLRPADFGGVLARPGFLLYGLACQFLLGPLLAVLLIRSFGLEANIAVGLILVAALPGGQMSKLFTYLARGNIALSITLTGVGTLASIGTVPLFLNLFATEHLQESAFVMPVGQVIEDVSLYLLLPLIFGMAVGHFTPVRRVLFSKTCIRIGLVFVAMMILGWAWRGQIQLTAYGWQTPLAIIIFCVGAMQLSLLPFRLACWSKPDAASVGIEVTMRNMNLALLIKALLFPSADAFANGVLFVILFYGGTAMVAGLSLSLRYRRMAARTQASLPIASLPTKRAA